MSFNTLKKVTYTEGLLLTAKLCDVAQNYPGNLMNNQNAAFFNSSGVLNGLKVTVSGNSSVNVDVGVAIDVNGQQLAVATLQQVPVDTSTDGNYGIYIQDGWIIDPTTNVTTETPIISQVLWPVDSNLDPNLILAQFAIKDKQISPIQDTRKNINTLPSVLMYPFALSIDNLTFSSSSLVQLNTITLPVMPFAPQQLLISAQEKANTSSPSIDGVFSVSVAKIDTSTSPATATIYIQFTPATGTSDWTGSLWINGIAWNVPSQPTLSSK